MGNSNGRQIRAQSKNIPLALVRRTGKFDCDGTAQSGSADAYSLCSHEEKSCTLGDHKEEHIQFWPSQLETHFIFEECYDYTPIVPSGDPWEVQSLHNQVELCTQALAIYAGSSLALNKRRIGRPRDEALAIIPMKHVQYHGGERLDLSEFNIVSLTGNIGRFCKVTTLCLAGNMLTALPEEIGLLGNLQELILSNNKLQSLPANIGLLEKLTMLHLENNELEVLPPEVGRLARLRCLDLSNNRIITLPREIGRLRALESLEARHNRLEWIPAEISMLKRLRKIELHGNPLRRQETFQPTKEGLGCDAESGLKAQSGVASLQELASRAILRYSVPLIKSLPRSLCNYLQGAKECTFCKGAFIESLHTRVRMLKRGEQIIPIVYFLCSPHWSDERGRVRAMFGGVQSPTMAGVDSIEEDRRGGAFPIGDRHAAVRGARGRKNPAPQGPIAETMSIVQLLKSQRTPTIPRYSAMTQSSQGISSSGTSLSSDGKGIDVEKLQVWRSQKKGPQIAVESRWLDLPTDLWGITEEGDLAPSG